MLGFDLSHGQDAHNTDFVLRQLLMIPPSSQAVPSQRRVQSEPSFAGSLLIRAYQELLSTQDRPVCVFSLSCSRFAMEAVQSRGIIMGSFLAADRLQRCNEFAPGHYSVDPLTGKLRDPMTAVLSGE
jgi:uncharacterized protein